MDAGKHAGAAIIAIKCFYEMHAHIYAYMHMFVCIAAYATVTCVCQGERISGNFDFTLRVTELPNKFRRGTCFPDSLSFYLSIYLSLLCATCWHPLSRRAKIIRFLIPDDI